MAAAPNLPMPSAKSPSSRAAGAILATVTAVVMCALLGGGSPLARAASTGRLQQQISAGQGRVSALSGAVSAADQRANELAASAASMEPQISRIQADLNTKRDQLLALRAKLVSSRERLVGSRLPSAGPTPSLLSRWSAATRVTALTSSPS